MSQRDKIRSKWRGGLPMGFGFLSVIVLVGILGGWGTQARLAGSVIAPGTVEVESRLQVVQHQEGGVIVEILASEGDLVSAGDVLMRFDDSLIRPEFRIINDQLLEVKARRARLLAERDDLDALPDVHADFVDTLAAHQLNRFEVLLSGQERLFDIRRKNLHTTLDLIAEQITQVEEQISGANAVLEASQAQLDIIERERQDVQSLFDRKLVSTDRLYQLTREEVGLRGSIGNTVSSIAQMRGKISEMKLRTLGERVVRREEAISQLRDFGIQEGQLIEERRVLMLRLQRLEIRAPVSGRIFGSRFFTIKSVAQPSEELMHIVPVDMPLVVNARINSVDVDKLYAGQKAKLRFSALDARTTPEIEGAVVHIAADVMIDEQTGMTFYEARVEPLKDALTELGDQDLVSGMPAEVYFTTSERTPMEYLVKPLADYFNTAWREE